MARTLIMLFLAIASARAQAADDIARELRAEFKGKVVTLRHFYSERELHYSSDGEVLSGRAGQWTLHGQVRIKDVSAEEGKLVIRAERLGVAYDPQKSDLQLIDRKEPVRIKLALADPSSLEATRTALMRIFISDNAELLSVIPDYWRPFIDPSVPKPVKPKRDNDAPRADLVQVRDGVTAPQVLARPEAQYQPEAQAVRLTGTV